MNGVVTVGLVRGWRRMGSLLVVLGVGLSSLGLVPSWAAGGSGVGGSSGFAMLTELYPDGAAVGRDRVGQGLASGVTFHSVLSNAERSFVTGSGVPFAYFSIPAEAGVASCYPAATDAAAGSTLTALTQQVGPDVWRLGTPEFDQGGGCWADGRPSPAGLSDQQAYTAWKDFYLQTKGLGASLGQSAAQRGYKWMSICVFAFCPQYAYDMGSDAVLLERNMDEVSGLSPGLAMVRGAARQHGGKQWGIDLSTWRYWNNGPTQFDSSGRLISGWSPATFKRDMYASYMAGADLIQNEAADYTTGGVNGDLNPLGQVVQEFNDFAFNRHPDRGTPYVPMALMQAHASGFEPKYGEWMQGAYKWYWKNPYTAGDTMLANTLQLAYPAYNTWGTVPADAPWKILNADNSINVSATQTAYRKALADGTDPRRWEPTGTTRWGETIDVITDQADTDTLANYQIVMLTTGQPLTTALQTTLTQYVQQGGTLVLNAKQLPASAETLTGAKLTTSRGTANTAVWQANGNTTTDATFNYTVVTPTTASVLAHTPGGDPLITRNTLGAGTVYLTTPDYLQDTAHTRILTLGKKLINTLQNQVSPVQIQGPPLQYLITTTGTRTTITLINTNTQGTTWNGTLTFPQPAGTVHEWTTDTTIPTTTTNQTTTVHATIPPYDLRIYTLNSGALTVATSSLPAASRNKSYRATLSASGGSGSYSWRSSQGRLPAGLRLKKSGLVKGKPKAQCIRKFQARVIDSTGATSLRLVRIRVRPPARTRNR